MSNSVRIQSYVRAQPTGSAATSTGETPSKPRILTLSDLIFGLALSISSLTLISQQPTNSAEFFTSLGLYALSFFILINVWRLYSSITSILPSETPTLSSLNLVLLFLVSIEPYLFAELFTGTGSLPATVTEVYALDLAFMFLILAVFNHTLLGEERKLAPKDQPGRYKRTRNLCVVCAIIFALSAVPVFVSIPVFTFTVRGTTENFTITSTLWVVALAFSWGSRLVALRTQPRTRKQ